MSESPSNARHAMTAARTLVALLLGVGFSFIFLNQSFTPEQTNFENAAVTGAETTDTFGVVDGFLIHCFGSRNAQRCLDGQASRAPKSAALWLGNSQVHAVNQLQTGQVNAAPILFSSLSAQGLDLLTFSLPNANLQEHYVMFEYLRQHMPLKVLILPVCFDDMREEGVRSPDVSDFVHDAETRRILIGSDIGRRIIKSASTAISGDGNSNMSNETKGITGTIQEQVERDLNAWLEEHSRLWRARPEIRGWLFYSVLYPLRNSLLGIKPSTTRKMIRSRYSNNRAALEETLRSAGGMPYEYEDFISRHALKRVRHVKVKNAFDLAVLMCRAKVFIGNQSSNFAIAEGLKVTRALEAFEPVPVATPVGGVCFEYINTKFLVAFLSNVLNMQLDAPEDIQGGDYYDSIKPQDGYVVPLKQRLKNYLGIAKKRRY